MERATQERLVGATLLIVAGVILIPWLLDGSMTGPKVSEQELVLPGGDDNGNETRRISLDVPGQQGASTTSGAGSIKDIDSRSVRDVDQGPAVVNLPTPDTRPPSTSETPARFAKPMKTAAPPDVPAQAAPAINKPAASGSSKPVANSGPAKTEVKALPKIVKTTPAPKIGVDTASGAATTAAAKASAAGAQQSGWAVQVGSFASQENAERLAERLRGKSYNAFVMRNVVEGRVRFRVRVGPVKERSEADLLASALREDRQPARVLSHP